jgi:hypothetical protein
MAGLMRDLSGRAVAARTGQDAARRNADRDGDGVWPDAGAAERREGTASLQPGYLSLFAGGGVKGGRILGATDKDGEHMVDTGWKYKKMQPKTENVYATIYSALGIDWKKELTETPSRRAYRYVDVLGATEFVIDDEIADLFV